MNLQERSDKRSLALHRAIVKRLRKNPELWDKPLQNIERWTEPDGCMSTAYAVWKDILLTWKREDIIKLLLSRSQRATQLRSSSPFVGIISQDEQNRIFEKYNKIYRRGLAYPTELNSIFQIELNIVFLFKLDIDTQNGNKTATKATYSKKAYSVLTVSL